jgi:FPC/CPF motif-containing protein YcgG
MQPSTDPPSAPAPARQSFTDFVAGASFPCVGAKSALHKDRLRFVPAGALGSEAASRRLVHALHAFSQEFQQPGTTPVSFIALFDPMALDELGFEGLLWRQLSGMHAYDASLGSVWDGSVSSDPAREEFSFSIGGRAFFVVGLHPGASRLARRSPAPCLVFNFHDQFEALKASGKYQTMQEAIRKRDVALQGSVNPVLSRFGDASEARQYSGRAVESDWACPFHRKETQDV